MTPETRAALEVLREANLRFHDGSEPNGEFVTYHLILDADSVPGESVSDGIHQAHRIAKAVATLSQSEDSE